MLMPLLGFFLVVSAGATRVVSVSALVLGAGCLGLAGTTGNEVLTGSSSFAQPARAAITASVMMIFFIRYYFSLFVNALRMRVMISARRSSIPMMSVSMLFRVSSLVASHETCIMRLKVVVGRCEVFVPFVFLEIVVEFLRIGHVAVGDEEINKIYR